ncbi:copper resistance CopC family protein [Rhizobium sp. HT1-10]|uniref:copper resistance CopC family protein n=1 Tax=Rhizobium sp. HT1-10 TaxID=3111638 RepID=UPI003C21458F
MNNKSRLALSLTLAAFLGFSSIAEAKLENPQPQPAPIQLNGANLVLVFSANVDLHASVVVIHDAKDRPVEIGKLQLANNGTDIKIPLKSPLRPGVYMLSWRALSSDGRESVGTYAVTVDPAPGDAPSVAVK